MKNLAMENKNLLWAYPDKTGILLKRGGKIKTWKKRQFILKNGYLFYFKILASVEQSEPAGVIPLESCKVGFSPPGVQTSAENVLIITLPDELFNLQIVKRTNYVLATESLDECESWIHAIRKASQSKRKIKAKLDHAQLEVRDLEQRWAQVKSRDAERMAAGMRTAPVKTGDKEDPVLLQALADDLMEAYHRKELLEKRISDSEKRASETSLQLAKIEEAVSNQEEAVLAKEDLNFLMESIHMDMDICSDSLEWVLPARFLFYTLQKQIEALEGLVEDGEGVPLSLEIECILRNTLESLQNIEEDTMLLRRLRTSDSFML